MLAQAIPGWQEGYRRLSPPGREGYPRLSKPDQIRRCGTCSGYGGRGSVFGGPEPLHRYNHCKHWSLLRSEPLQRRYRGVTGRYKWKRGAEARGQTLLRQKHYGGRERQRAEIFSREGLFEASQASQANGSGLFCNFEASQRASVGRFEK